MSDEEPVDRAGPALAESDGSSGALPDAPADDAAADDEQAGADEIDLAAQYPPVVAVVVTRNPGPWLEETLHAYGAQDYPDLTVLVVDCGSDDDPTPRIAEALGRAFVRRLDASAGFPAAANEALHTVEGATFLLVSHDDVVPDPDAVRLMVEEAYRSNAGIVGPKLVAADDHEVLLEVGRAVDRFGAWYTGIEPGEIDQEQHDGVRDVFYVPSAAMLVRADLFAEMGGFDPETFPGAEDLDLCWRARLAGARIVVAPDARVAHHEAARHRPRADRPDDLALVRSRVRVLLTSYSLPTLLWLVPAGLAVAVVEAIADLVVGRPRRARASVGGWLVNLVHLRSLRAARHRAQERRRVHDGDLRELQVGTVTRLQAFFAQHLHGADRLRSFRAAGRSAVDTVSDSLRAPVSLALLGFLVLVGLGSRSFLSHGPPAVGTFGEWPGVGHLFSAFGSAWRPTGLGSRAPAPAAIGLFAVFGTLLFGAVGFARTAVVVLALPLGVFGTYRFARRLVALSGPAAAAALAYGVNPVARNALATGRLGPLALFGLLPFAFSATVRLAAPDAARRGRVLRLALLVALLAALYPVGAALYVVAVAALVIAVPVARGGALAIRALVTALAAGALALVLLFPWPLAYAHTGVDRGSLGFVVRPDLDLAAVLRFQTGPAGAGFVVWGLLVSAAVALFVATGERLAWVARAWVLALVGWATVWVPARFFPGSSVPFPEAGLVLAAFGVAIAAGIAVSVLVAGIHNFRFGWRQPAAVLGGIALLFPMLGFAADAVDGRWHAPSSDWTSTLSWTQAQASRGQLRVLWLGNPAVLPSDPVLLADGSAYTLTRNGPGDVTEQWRAPERSADHVLDRALDLAIAGRTDRLGRMLAPMGVRYVVVLSRQGPDGGAVAPASPALRDALAAQLDLARRRSDSGIVLYENLAYAPVVALVRPGTASVPAHVADPNRAAVGVDLSGARAVGSGGVPAGTVLDGRAYDAAFDATSRGVTLPHSRSFGWANAYRLARPGAVAIHDSAQWRRWAFLAGALVVWGVVVVRLWRTRVRRAPRDRSAQQARLERQERRDTLVDVLAGEEAWWERV